MARNQEKAQAMLNRFIQAKKDAVMGVEQKRPFLASEVEDVNECERWRSQIIREVSKNITAIQNGSLGEHKIRDLNDTINKLLREKKHWERQIKILGGRDYLSTAPKITDSDGRGAMGTEGYYYFGAARELPGVRELFDRTGQADNKKNRYELHKLVDADYYGYGDDDDGKLIAAERRAEKRLREEVERDWVENTKAQKEARYKSLGMEVPEDEEDPQIDRGDGEEDVFKAHVPLPSTADIEKLVLEKKKRELLAKYKTSK
mmetsp:Transcript_21918/g.43516  ORF Transcript_21918/g.43516 Transcript_21918/m.43516 type:complete len:261 (+) Transcript_21918:75-857(+)|eukprot:CAMPEP_0175149810 /NCGR_PEP_ID=MMETSP0087-20121206/17474_1 /TAXON_ID=136419 /ORGANISM="Unknown Unknown, Strain D1" /LENGTH=260 /DNA_ID=CAMNT_0016435591 /DNA_START=75 /DNA_END=857 /DNA_ORIENTATION=+